MHITRRSLSRFIWGFNIWVGLSLIFTWIGASGWGFFSVLTFPGYWLWGSFSFMAFYPCLYLTVMYYQGMRDKLTPRFLFAWHYGILIFFTLSLFFRFITAPSLDAPVLRFLAGIFGAGGGATLSLLFVLVELVTLYQLDVYLFGAKEEELPRPRKTKEEALSTYHEEGFSLDQEEEEFLINELEEAKKSPLTTPLSFQKMAEEPNLYGGEAGDDEATEQDRSFAPMPSISLPIRREEFQTGDREPIIPESNERTEEGTEEDTVYLPLSTGSRAEELRDGHAFNFTGEEAEEPTLRGQYSDDVHELTTAQEVPKTILETVGLKKKKYDLKGFFGNGSGVTHYEVTDENKREAQILKTTLAEFNIEAEVVGIYRGPVVTTFEILPAQGIKLSRITSLSDNIALRLAAPRVRILAPIPGKEAVGIELPNKVRDLVTLGELFSSPAYTENDMKLPVALGKTVLGDVQIFDLARAPHLLIAGATGAGKSVCLNTLIVSLLYALPPEELKLVMIDPKIVELKFFNDIPHLITPVITDAKKALQVMQWCVGEMERRYHLLDTVGTRDITSFNKKVKEANLAIEPFPYMVVIMDEFADLMMLQGKELESLIARLAAMSRAVGIHLVLATQRPSVDVITGIIKANFPSRIAFMVSSKMDSRIILDAGGADQLLGKGDMLVGVPWIPYPERLQGAFLSESDVESFVDKVKTFGEPDYLDAEIFDEPEQLDDDFDDNDPLYERAVEIVVTEKKASASYLQRRLRIGYNRAARFVELMENQGIVGPQQGAKPREILR